MYGSPSTATRKLTALSMPRTAGLSGSSRVWCMRRKPSDWTVARISGLAPIGDFMRVARSVLSGTRRPSGACRRHLPTLWGGPIPGAWGGGTAGGARVRGGQALAHHLADFLATQVGDLLRRPQLLQRGQGRAHGVDRVVGAVRLGEDVFDPGRLDDGAHRATRDDAGARRGGLEHDARGAPLE